MSGTTTAPAAPAPPNYMMLGAIIISAVSSVTFLVALVISYFAKDQTNLQLLVGAVVANGSTVVSYWLGSSAGSARKTDLLAPPPAPTTTTTTTGATTP